MTTREFIERYGRHGRNKAGLCILRTDIGTFAEFDADGHPRRVTFGYYSSQEALEAHVARWASSTNFKMEIVKIADVLDVPAAGTEGR